MFSKALFVLTAVALAVNAQSSTVTSPVPSGSASTSGTSPCILACVAPAAAQNGCSGPYVFHLNSITFGADFVSRTDLPCVCTNAQFQSDAGACLQQHCSAADLQSALQLQQAGCSAGNAFTFLLLLNIALLIFFPLAGLSATTTATPTPNPVSFTSVAATPTASGAGASGGTGATKGASTTTPAPSKSPSASAAAGSNLQAGAGAFFGAVLAAVFAL